MKRPDGVTLISIYHFVEAGLYLLGSCFLIAVPFIVTTAARYDPDARVAIPIVWIVIVIAMVVLVVLAAANVAVGWGLWQMRPWSRLGAIVLSVLRLFSVPLGTIIGGLCLWYLFQPEAQAAFEQA